MENPGSVALLRKKQRKDLPHLFSLAHNMDNLSEQHLGRYSVCLARMRHCLVTFSVEYRQEQPCRKMLYLKERVVWLQSG